MPQGAYARPTASAPALTGAAWLFWPLFVVTLWSIYFFRDPPRGVPQDDGLLIAPADGLVQSDALVRLEFSAAAPIGLLALGARESGKFHAGQGTELLTFFAKALARLIRQWLDLPPS